MCKVTRIHLKTDSKDRAKLIDYCLRSEKQCVAIGWSDTEGSSDFKSYEDYYYAVKDKYKRMNHCHNVFWYAEAGDLFWTRDLDGKYWICRATGKAEPKNDPEKDIGAIIPVKAYQYGLEVPGQIKVSFNRPRGGTCEDIWEEKMIAFSKKAYNEASKTETYKVERIAITGDDVLDALPPFDLEELVITYLQIKGNYYLLSNSIAKNSTTVKIECELFSRDKANPRKAVVQVKGGKEKTVDALDYKTFVEDGYLVYFYAPVVNNAENVKNCIVITRDQLRTFYMEYKSVLPKSITKWEELL